MHVKRDTEHTDPNACQLGGGSAASRELMQGRAATVDARTAGAVTESNATGKARYMQAAGAATRRDYSRRHEVAHVFVDEFHRFDSSAVSTVRACQRATGRHVRRSRPSHGRRQGSRRGGTARSSSRGDPSQADPGDGESDDEHRVAALAGGLA